MCLVVFCQVGRVFEVGWDGGEKWLKEVQNPPGLHKELVGYKQFQTEVDVRFICKIVYWTKYCLATEAIIGQWYHLCEWILRHGCPPLPLHPPFPGYPYDSRLNIGSGAITMEADLVILKLAGGVERQLLVEEGHVGEGRWRTGM